MTYHKGALWPVDRASIDAQFWYGRKRRLGVTMITRVKRVTVYFLLGNAAKAMLLQDNW